MDTGQYKKEILPLRDGLLQYAARLLKCTEEAEDTVQEVLLKLWCIRSELGKYRNIPGLAMQMTKNNCLNKLQDIRTQTVSIETHSFVRSEVASPLRELEEKEDLERALQILKQLPPLQQLIMRMKHLDGYEIDEIAGLTGSSVESVRMHLSRGRRAIKEQFLKEK